MAYMFEVDIQFKRNIVGSVGSVVGLIVGLIVVDYVVVGSVGSEVVI
jgi:hypothetical protein